MGEPTEREQPMNRLSMSMVSSRSSGAAVMVQVCISFDAILYLIISFAHLTHYNVSGKSLCFRKFSSIGLCGAILAVSYSVCITKFPHTQNQLVLEGMDPVMS